MKFEKKIESYLDGTLFSRGLNVKIAQNRESSNDRLQLVENLVTGHSVIHVGCVDHLPLLNEKIKRDTWLHSRMCKRAKRCLGIDSNAEGIRYIKDILGYSDVICADLISNPPEEIMRNQWDYIVLGEVLEHIQNPVAFLKKVKEQYGNHVSFLIITVPNAFSYLNIFHVIFRKEVINSDHYYWFSPYTLAKNITAAGMHVEYFQFCEPCFPSKDNRRIISFIFDIIRYYLTTLFPATHQTLVMVAKLS